jgi:membrane protein required for colicin V production|nr:MULTISPECIES: CvpA family protein [unclassified Proteiniphilum]
MNWFDLTIGIILLVAFINGYRKGFVMQVIGFATVVLAAIFGGRIAEKILPGVINISNLSTDAAKVLSFILAFALIAIVLSLIGRLLQRFIDMVFLSIINRLLGAVIAAGTMMLFLSIILNMILMLDKNELIIKKNIKEESFFFERVEVVLPAIVPYIDKEFSDGYVPEKYRKEIEKKSDSIFQTKPNSNAIDSTFQKRHFETN